MGIKLIKRDWENESNSYLDEYVADTAADVSSLPTCGTGSTALIIESGEVYVVNTAGTWSKFGGTQ